jgi:hypothetical protein
VGVNLVAVVMLVMLSVSAAHQRRRAVTTPGAATATAANWDIIE